MKIKIIKDYRPKEKNFSMVVGDVFEARIVPLLFGRVYQVTEKGDSCINFSGCIVPETHCIELEGEEKVTKAEYIEQHRELLQLQEEAAELKKQLQKNQQRYYKETARLQNEVDAARKAAPALNLELAKASQRIIELEREIHAFREAKKVPLPREVAEAIEFYLSHFISKIDIYHLGCKGTDGKYAAAIHDWINSNGGKAPFMEALVNGYTIEEPETFTTNRKLDASEIRTLRNWYKGALMRLEDGTDKDEFCREAIEEVALYLGGAKLLEDLSGFCKTQLNREKAQ